jgi:hypothetical protein
MITIAVDTTAFEAAAREFAREGRKDLEVVIREQAAIMTGHLIALTPPAAGRGQAMNDRGGITLEAKKRGEAAIAADIAALFPTTRLKEDEVDKLIEAGFQWGTGRGRKIIRQYAGSEADMARIHAASRSANGRVRTGNGENMALVRAATRRAFIRSQQKKVGLLNAGWLNAARELKTSRGATPAWITRHPAQAGGVTIHRPVAGVAIRIYNEQPWFPKDMDARVERAMRRRTAGLQKAVEAMVERRAKRAEERMGR